MPEQNRVTKETELQGNWVNSVPNPAAWTQQSRTKTRPKTNGIWQQNSNQLAQQIANTAKKQSNSRETTESISPETGQNSGIKTNLVKTRTSYVK